MNSGVTIDKQTGQISSKRKAMAWSAKPVTDNLTHLLAAHERAQAAAEDFTSHVKAVAEKAGIQPSALRRYVAARASEKYPEKKAEAQQLMLLFEEVA